MRWLRSFKNRSRMNLKSRRSPWSPLRRVSRLDVIAEARKLTSVRTTVAEESMMELEDAIPMMGLYHDVPIYEEPLPFVFPAPYVQVASPVFASDPITSPFLSIFEGNGTAFHSPIRPSTPSLAWVPRHGSMDSNSSSEGSYEYVQDRSPSPPTSGLDSTLSLPYDEYLNKLEEGYFGMWAE